MNTYKIVKLARFKILVFAIFFFQFFIQPFETHVNAQTLSAYEINKYLNGNKDAINTAEDINIGFGKQPLTPAEIADIERVAKENQRIAQLNEKAAKINAFLSTKNSPLYGYGLKIALLEEKYGAPSSMVVAISGIESSFCTINFKPYNCWGWMTGRIFTSYDESLDAYFSYLSGYYYARGYNTPESIGPIYCVPPDHWISKVRYFLTQIDF